MHERDDKRFKEEISVVAKKAGQIPEAMGKSPRYNGVLEVKSGDSLLISRYDVGRVTVEKHLPDGTARSIVALKHVVEHAVGVEIPVWSHGELLPR